MGDGEPALLPTALLASERLPGLLPFALLGAGLAGLYLASLWLSVRALGHAGRPGAWMLAGAFLRVAGVCGGLWAIAGGQALRTGAALAGFVVARTLALAWVRRKGPAATASAAGRLP